MDPVVAAVIPSRSGGARPVVGPRQVAGRVVPLAVADLPCLPAAGGVVYGMGRLDSSGRVSDRWVVDALGWGPGECLTMTAVGAVVVIRRDARGVFTLPGASVVAIPAAVRARCGLRPGARVLLVADPARQTLLAYPMSVLDQILAPHHPWPAGNDPS